MSASHRLVEMFYPVFVDTVLNRFSCCTVQVIWSYKQLLLTRSSHNQGSSSSQTAPVVGMIEIDRSSQVV